MEGLKGLQDIMAVLKDDSLPNNVRFIKILKEAQKLKKGESNGKST